MSLSRAWSFEICPGGMAEHSVSFLRAKETTPSKRKAPSDDENTPKSKKLKREKEAKLFCIAFFGAKNETVLISASEPHGG